MRTAHGAATARPSHGSGGLEGLVLDIGGAVGALIVYVDPRWVDRELEVSPLEGGSRTHTVVHEHRAGVFAGVFAELAEGRYAVLRPATSAPWGEVLVTGGAIVELDRRAS